jgi:hypothetical protein
MNPHRRLAVPTSRATAARLAACLAVAASLSGCSSSPGSRPVDAVKARAALKTALDGWKRGDSPAALKDATPPIVVQDFDWMGGARLVDYRVEGEGKALEANLYVPVKLTLKPPQGKEVTKTVSYVIGTSPHVSVFRDFR